MVLFIHSKIIFVLFIHLKIILLQYFSVFSFQFYPNGSKIFLKIILKPISPLKHLGIFGSMEKLRKKKGKLEIQQME